MDPLFLDDGFTRTHRLPAAPGLHPAAEVVFRPALAKERTAYVAALNTNDPDKVDRHECDLIAKYVLKIDDRGPDDWKHRLPRLHPSVKAALVNVVLGYAPARPPEADIADFPGASG
jgi:hypothetical protein